MEDRQTLQPEEKLMTDNIVFIEFYNKKNFPPGVWMREPDFVAWQAYGLSCLAIRDMRLGIWRGFVGVTKDHPAFSKTLLEMLTFEWGVNLNVHGGITVAGKLPIKYKELNKNTWWVGFECGQGEDLLPLVKMDITDPILSQINGLQTYKDLKYVRKEVFDLAKQICRIKK